jgi:hypothetical protein
LEDDAEEEDEEAADAVVCEPLPLRVRVSIVAEPADGDFATAP